MANKRVEMYRLQKLVWLHRQGLPVRRIRQVLQMGTETERKYRRALIKAGLLEGDPNDPPSVDALHAAVVQELGPGRAVQVRSTVEPWMEEVRELVERGAGAQAIYDKLRLEHGDEFQVSESAVKRAVRRLKAGQKPKATEVVLRVETEPGQQAQVDFGTLGKVWDGASGRARTAYVFVMVLSYSRYMYAEVALDQKAETWQRLHKEAFEWFGGVVEEVVPDNLKAAVIRKAFGYEEVGLHRGYEELARHYGFVVAPTPVRQPAKKGKVERAIGYVKRSFVATRDIGAMSVEELRRELGRWLEEVANRRVHGTTGRVPQEVFEQEERGALKALPERPWQEVDWREAKVHVDGHFHYDRACYSVPYEYIGQRVWVRATDRKVEAWVDSGLVAEHDRQAPYRWSTKPEHLPDGRADFTQRSKAYWVERGGRIDPEVGEYVRELFERGGAASRLRQVQGLVRMLEKYPRHRARRACQRAAWFGAWSYKTVKKILLQGKDLEDWESEGAEAQSEPPHQYARTVWEIVPQADDWRDEEGSDERGR